MLYSCLNILTSFINQIVIFILIYKLDSREFGIYSLILVYGGVLCVLCFNWNDILILNLGAKEVIYNGHIKNTLRTRTSLIFISMTLLGVIYLLFKPYIHYFDKNNIVNVDLVILYFLSQLLYNFFSNVFFAKGFNNLQSVLNIIPRVVTVIYLLYYFSSIPVFLYFLLVVNMIYFIICLMIYLSKEYKDKVDFNLKKYKSQVSFALMQSIGIVGVYILNWGDNLALQYYDVSLDKIGSYNFAYRIFLGFNVFFGLLNIITPKIIHSYTKSGDRRPLTRLFNFKFYFVSILSIAYLALVFIIKKLLFVFNKVSYFDSFNYMIYLFIPFILMAYTAYYMPIIINTDFYRKIQTTTFYQAIINVICNFVFMYFYGIYGVFMGTAISYVYRLFVLEKLFQNDVKIYFNKFHQT